MTDAFLAIRPDGITGVIPCSHHDLRNELLSKALVTGQLLDAAGPSGSRTPSWSPRKLPDVRMITHGRQNLSAALRVGHHPKFLKYVDGGYVFTCSPNWWLISMQQALPLIVEM